MWTRNLTGESLPGRLWAVPSRAVTPVCGLPRPTLRCVQGVVILAMSADQAGAARPRDFYRDYLRSSVGHWAQCSNEGVALFGDYKYCECGTPPGTHTAPPQPHIRRTPSRAAQSCSAHMQRCTVHVESLRHVWGCMEASIGRQEHVRSPRTMSNRARACSTVDQDQTNVIPARPVTPTRPDAVHCHLASAGSWRTCPAGPRHV